MMNSVLWLLFPGYSLMLLVATHWPAERLPPLSASDKSLHLAAYFVLGVLAFWHFQRFIWTEATWSKWIGLLFMMALFGAVDELTQPFFQRFADFQDWVADIFGIMGGLMFAHLLNWYQRRQSRPGELPQQ